MGRCPWSRPLAWRPVPDAVVLPSPEEPGLQQSDPAERGDGGSVGFGAGPAANAQADAGAQGASPATRVEILSAQELGRTLNSLASQVLESVADSRQLRDDH